MKKYSIFALLLSCALIAGCKSTGGYSTGPGSSATDTATTAETTDTGTTTETTTTTTTETTTTGGEEHTHVGVGDYQFDNNNHWKECECGEQVDVAAHKFDQKVVTEAYLKSGATCEVKAQYYYSCVCGKAGTTTFESGEKGPHTPADYWGYNESKHWHPCTVCEQAVGTADHVWQEIVKPSCLKSKGDCTNPTVYYKSCECGKKSTETFQVNAPGHKQMPGFEHNNLTHWRLCENCDKHLNENTHKLINIQTISDSAVYSHAVAECSVCNEVVQFVTDESYKYSLTVNPIPEFKKGGKLTISAEKDSIESTFVYNLPSLEEDLARPENERALNSVVVFSASEFANTTYRFGLNTNLVNIINLIRSEDADVNDPNNIDLSGIVNIIKILGTNCSNYFTEVPYTQTVGNMFVEETYSITGRGPVATGTINGGVVKTGDSAKIYNPGSSTPINSTVIGIECAHKLIDSAEAGLSCGLNLRGVNTSDIVRGARIVIGDTEATPITKGTACIKLFTKEEGGRHTPMASGIRPQLYIGGTDITGQLTYSDSLLVPGGYKDLINFELLQFIPITQGQLISIREGGRFIGQMVVTSVTIPGSTKLQLENDLDFHSCEHEDGYVLNFDDISNLTSITIAPGTKDITLATYDFDAGGYLGPYAIDKVLYEHEEDLEITFQVELPNGTMRTPFRYSNYLNIGSVDDTGGIYTLVLAGQPDDCPELFDSTGAWKWSDSETLRLIVYIGIGENLM